MSKNTQLYFGGEIYTVDDTNPIATAVAVKDGMITAVGSESQCRSKLGKQFESVDLKGAVLLPGFIDTHTHPPVMVIFEMNADLTGVTSMSELQDRIREMAQKDTSSNWIMGLQFEEQDLKHPRLPTRHDLDTACPDRPVIIVKRDGHTIVANSKVIEITGISASTDDPEGGCIDREPDGYPAGVFRETAAQILLDAMPFPEIQTILDATSASVNKIAAHGITSIGMVLQTDEEGISGSKGVFDIPLMEMVHDHIPINLYGLLVASDIARIQDARKTILHQPGNFSNRCIGALKFWADGTFASCTANVSLPYSDQPDKKGFLIHSPDEMYRRMVDAHTAGLQIAIHSIGDESTQTCINLYDRLLQQYPKEDHRHRLEHASLLNADLISQIARLNLVVSTQPIFIHSEKGWLNKRLGPDRTPWVYAFRSLLDAGVKIAGASDAPVEPLDVLHAIQCCVTREGFETSQCITVQEAIRMYTIDAAYAQFEETVKGSISVGKRADMVVLDKNPASVLPDDIKNIRVERTICGGETVYQNESK